MSLVSLIMFCKVGGKTYLHERMGRSPQNVLGATMGGSRKLWFFPHFKYGWAISPSRTL